ncbi:MBOAT family O-acyltransferase [Paenibacillus sp. strain BS8-2]
MWYLNAYSIVSLVVMAALLAVLGLFSSSIRKPLRMPLILLFSVVFLSVYSLKLAVFSILYVIGNYILFRCVLGSAGWLRKPAFVGAIAANIVALFVLRLYAKGELTHAWFDAVLLLGLVYTLLKVINTFYYAYYVAEKPGPSLAEYACYLLFIPTFTSGPLLKFHEFLRDLRSDYRLDGELLEWSVKRIIRGLFKKLVLVSLLMMVYKELLSGDLNAWQSAAVLFVFYVLLYFDFSGYSDIAIGFGRLMGIQVPENFKKPFSSPTMTQFWRNWHATLGDWFREHVFQMIAPKAGSRIYAAFISFFIMFLVGLWHGISPLFILWGIYHGVLLALETLLKQTMVNKRKVSRAQFVARCVMVNIFIGFGTIFFSENTEVAMKILRGFSVWNG